jgi:hypothetical protein
MQRSPVAKPLLSSEKQSPYRHTENYRRRLLSGCHDARGQPHILGIFSQKRKIPPF